MEENLKLLRQNLIIKQKEQWQKSERGVVLVLSQRHILVVLYGKNLETAHIDIIGSSISLAAKIKSIAAANQVLIGEYIYIPIVSLVS